MIELNEKARIYAEENVINVLKDAIAKVYADGYTDGYKDCQNHESVNLRISNTEYIDLGLPSGTLWSTDYEKDGEDNMFIPYELASNKSLPSKAQWEELKKYAKWDYICKDGILKVITCAGPNGNTLSFYPTGGVVFAKKVLHGRVCFWIKDETEPNCAVHMWVYYNSRNEYTGSEDSDLKFPVRLVRTK